MSLSTHVLNIMTGLPAMAMPIRFMHGETLLFEGKTDTDGRCPALRDIPLEPGRYRLSFGVAAYFRAQGVTLADPPFLDVVTIDFGVAGTGHFHVPLLASPFSYSTYRGS